MIEGQSNGWPPKAGIGEIVKFGPLFLVDMDGEKLFGLFKWVKNLMGGLRRALRHCVRE
jgi:hypothetical protein